MDEKLGRVTIAPNVLVTIVQKTATSIGGVARLHDSVPAVKRLLGLHTVGQGVEVEVTKERAVVDVYVVARRGVDLRQMGRELQKGVTRAIEDIVGMDVAQVNVHIEDVATELPNHEGSEER